MKYICKQKTPFCDVGTEVSINKEMGIITVPSNGKKYNHMTFNWNSIWSPIEDFFEPKRWRAEIGEKYLYINIDMGIGSTEEIGSIVNDTDYKNSNYFKNEEIAEKARLLVLEALKKAHE